MVSPENAIDLEFGSAIGKTGAYMMAQKKEEGG